MSITLQYACLPPSFNFIVSGSMMAAFRVAIVIDRFFSIDVTANIQNDFLIGSCSGIRCPSLNKKKRYCTQLGTRKQAVSLNERATARLKQSSVTIKMRKINCGKLQ